MKDLVYGGEVYSNFEIDENGNIQNKKTNHIYKKSVHKQGYLVVYLPMGKRGKVKCIRIHKAVAETFIPNPNNYPIVNHKDENKANCNVENLEWTTPKGNTQAHLAICSKTTPFFNGRKLTSEDVKNIRSSKGIISLNKLAKEYNVSKRTIINIQKRIYYADVS